MSKACISSLMLAEVKHPSPPDIPACVQPCSIPKVAKDTRRRCAQQPAANTGSSHVEVAHFGRKAESRMAPALPLAWLKLCMALGKLPLAL